MKAYWKVPASVPIWIAIAAAQTPPASPDRPWHAEPMREISITYERSSNAPRIDPEKVYSVGELIDVAESHNPETRAAWEAARAQAAKLGISRSELFPTLAAVALAEADRLEAHSGPRFYRQTVPVLEISLEFNYTILDFGARRGRIDADRARLLAANFEFNDVHRRIIFTVFQAYYRLLNATGQEQAAESNLANARAVQNAAEERLRNGLGILPDVLEARSARAQAEYDLQTVLGSEEIARGDLATTLAAPASTRIEVQPLDDLTVPERISGPVEEAIHRALGQRPDLLAQAAEIRAAQAERKEARAAFYPQLTAQAIPQAQALYVRQQTLPWGSTADLTGSASFRLTWNVFDGGARQNRLKQAEAHAREAEARLGEARDRIEDEVWASYSNLATAMRQRQAATELVNAASQSYNAALESYNYGVRDLLDVTQAQKLLAQARSSDVQARTQVLAALADLAFQAGDAIQQNAARSQR